MVQPGMEMRLGHHIPITMDNGFIPQATDGSGSLVMTITRIMLIGLMVVDTSVGDHNSRVDITTLATIPACGS